MKTMHAKALGFLLFLSVGSPAGFALESGDSQDVATLCQLNLLPSNVYSSLSYEDLATQWKLNGFERRVIEDVALKKLKSLIVLKAMRSFRSAYAVEDINDYISAGYIALRESFEKYRPESGSFLVCFSMFLRKAFIKEIKSNRFVSGRPRRFTDQQRHFRKPYKHAVEILFKRGEPLNAETIAQEMKVPLDDKFYKQYDFMRAFLKYKSLDDAFYGGDGKELSLVEVIPASEDTIPSVVLEKRAEDQKREQMLTIIDELRKELTEKQLYVLEHRILAEKPMQLTLIAEKFNVSVEAVRKWEVKAKKKISSQVSGSIPSR